MTKTVTHTSDVPFLGDTPLLDKAASSSFSDLIFEILSGSLPTQPQSQVFTFILNCTIDHGPDTPSAKKTIELANIGKTISESVAEGLKEINDVHGGAIEPAMDLLYKIQSQSQSLDSVIAEYTSQNKRLPGFGHRLYVTDPRAQKLLDMAKKLDSADEFIVSLLALETQLTILKGKQIPINIDGAIAAVLCSFGWSSKIGKAVFIVARTPGLCAHWLQTYDKVDSK